MPEDPWPWEMLGHCHLLLEQYDEALATYDQALLFNRDGSSLYYGRAFVYLAQDDAGAALEDFERVLRLDSNHAGARYGRGLAHAADWQHEEAIADFTWVIEHGNEDEYIWPYFVDTHPLIDRAWSYYELERVDEALADLDALLERIPDFHIAYYHRGLLYKELGQIERARADFEEAWRLFPDPEWRAMVEEELEDLE
jgi:tetratricopeptide (TPR) repeat protein